MVAVFRQNPVAPEYDPGKSSPEPSEAVRARAATLPDSVPAKLKIAVVTDAWLPQTNGVVRTLCSLRDELAAMGHQIVMVTPQDFVTIPCPSYAEIRLALTTPRGVGKMIDQIAPDAIHIVTEGPLGLAARSHCRSRGLIFTTSFHTKFPDYIEARWGVPANWTYAALRWFHSASAATMVATESVRRELQSHGFENLRSWTRGVDLQHFHPAPKPATDWPRPIFLSVGRVAVEKNLSAFLDLDLPGTKVVVGDGPQRAELERRYPSARFVGRHEGEALAALYSLADVFVFPSRTDTFGLVLLEALASGVPIAAFPVSGPIDLVGSSGVGALSEDLKAAALAALDIDPEKCRLRAAEFTWQNSARQFLHNLRLTR
jgi:glycosyltransferase involved in cell wall biosynthesis